MEEAMCSVDDYTVVPREVQTYDPPWQIIHHDKVFSKSMDSKIKFESSCC